ncbi:disease resistance protein RUN1-like [Manihot esculenta]|uniref:disease resistance protein RUN1-like n=1 Tax=Manihot esculenta TaxID=3983 RepID=UPI001CC669BC|nr:disease resistance protein RUN1-like [Manihot esculenta]
MNTKGQIIFPIFYNVDPSDVRKQKGYFEKAFAKHDEDFGQNAEKVNKWRTTLTKVANLSGWDSHNRHETELIQDIVEAILARLNHAVSAPSEKLIGIDDHLEKMNSCLAMRFDDVRLVGIHGMGGIGKTTLAREIFDRISNQFESSSFVANVREVSEKSGLCALQHQLLSELLNEKNIKIWDVCKGSNMIRNRICRKRVLVVLDDVDKRDQLEHLAGNHDWFGLGSRIIITTRDVHLLVQHNVDEVYKMETLNHCYALKLFSLKAFKSDNPMEGFIDLSEEIVRYAQGLPLALKVLGCFFYGKSLDEWTSALGRIKEDSEKEIFDRLEISFHGLKPTEKKIFLDIACVFKGMDKDYVMNLLDSFGFHAAIGIRVLIDKSLLTIIGNNTLWMHDLLQEIGQKIVWKESPDEPGKRSRLWVDKDVYHVLTENSGTEAVEMMTANFLGRKNINLSAKALSNMRKLRLLKMANVQLSQGLEFLSNEIRLLEWHGYPLKSLPLCFKPEKLVELRMPCSCIKQLWSGIITLDGLKFIDLSHSQALRRTPDFTRAPNLEKLVLEGCTSLIEVHPSIFLLKRLIILNMKDCIGLQTLPISIEMPSLQVLILSGCFKLKKFPEIKGNMEHLLELHLEGTAIVELPLSIEHLSGLVLLNLRNCKRLISLPSNIFHYISLKTLILSGCSKFDKFPGKLGNEECLEELDISGTAVRQLPSSIVLLKNLRRLTWQGCEVQPSEPWSSLLNYFSSWQSLTSLNLSNCNFPGVVVPSDIGCLSSLEDLDLSFNKFASLPASISQLSSLTLLRLVGCKWLQSLPELPANVKYVFAGGCIALENIPNPLKPCTLRVLKLDLFNCHGLVDHHNLSSWACKLLKTHLKGLSSETSFFKFGVCIPGSEIPEWFKNQNMGSSISVDLPPHRNNDNLMGFAFCANFILRPSASSNYGYEKKTRSRDFILGCRIKNDQGEDDLIDSSFYLTTLEENSAQIGLDHLWLVCKRLHSISKTASLDGHDPNGSSLSFWAQSVFSNVEVEYRKCGFRFAYSQDLEE